MTKVSLLLPLALLSLMGCHHHRWDFDDHDRHDSHDDDRWRHEHGNWHDRDHWRDEHGRCR